MHIRNNYDRRHRRQVTKPNGQITGRFYGTGLSIKLGKLEVVKVTERRESLPVSHRIEGRIIMQVPFFM